MATSINTNDSEGPTAIESDVKIMTKEDQKNFAYRVKSIMSSVGGLKLSIMCGGPTGVGKTSLINGLLGSKVFGVRTGTDSEDSLQRGTNKVMDIIFEKKGVMVTVWDTPGLEHESEVDERFLREIKEKCAGFDLFIYCINGSESRATEVIDDNSSLAKFNELFGSRLWKHTVIVLTQANVIADNLEEEREINPDINIERSFGEKVNEWSSTIKDRLRSLGVDEKNVTETPIIPVGCMSYPTLPGHSENWFTELFEAILERLPFRAMLALLKINDKRIKSPTDGDSPTDSHSLELDEQDIVISNKLLKLINNYLPVGSGLASAAAGAATGATIGALLIGIPSFGMFAGLGLAVGGMAGAAVGGGGLALITRVAAVYYIKKKLKKKRKKNIAS